MTEQQRAGFMRLPFNESRFWMILLWVLAVTGGLALLDLAERHFRTQAAGQPVMMLARQAADAQRRADLKNQIITQPGVAGARWRTPEELAASISGRFPQGQWADLFPGDVAWLPWLLEVYPADPLANPAGIHALMARWRQQPEVWSVVLWDGQTIDRLAAQRRTVRLTLGFWILLAGLSGAAGLMRQPWPPQGGKAMAAWSALLSVLTPAGVWVVGWLRGGVADLKSLAVIAVTGFLMAAVIAPLLRERRRQSQSWVVNEENNEREDDR